MRFRFEPDLDLIPSAEQPVLIDTLSNRLQDKLSSMVAAEFGLEPDRVGREPGGFRTPDGRFHTVAEAASLGRSDRDESLRYEADPFDAVEIFAALAAEIQVDAETGAINVNKIVNAQEVGRVISPLMHQGQIDGGIIQGLGYATSEGIVFDEGRVMNLNLGEYKMPVTVDIPPLQTILLDPDLSLGITPIGEGPNCATSACLVNAIVDAIGEQVGIPRSAEALAAALRAE